MISVHIEDILPPDISPTLLERAAGEVLQYTSSPLDASLTILLTGDEKLQQLNLQYRGIDETTDVLAFPADYTDPDSGSLYLGDVLISTQRAAAQAAAGGHAPGDEIQLLVVHGVLHLLGYDHADAEGEARMWSTQDEILRRLGCHVNPPTA